MLFMLWMCVDVDVAILAKHKHRHKHKHKHVKKLLCVHISKHCIDTNHPHSANNMYHFVHTFLVGSVETKAKRTASVTGGCV
jgi:hypothetical protein